MAGIAFILSPDGSADARRECSLVLDAMRHRGRDRQRIVSGAGYALGVREDALSSASAGESQPLAHRDLLLAFDGRLDNRDDIASVMGLAPRELSALSDAALIMRLYCERGASGIERLRGPFALIFFNTASRKVVMVRDIVGGRRLVFARGGRRLVIASEEQALMKSTSVDREPDAAQMAHHLAGLDLLPGRTFFRSISDVAAGTSVTIDADRCAVETYYQPEDNIRKRGGVEGLWIEEFNALLEASVTSRLRGLPRADIMMSGGLDSTTVAAIGAQSGLPTHAWSWSFDRFPDCDERMYIRAMGKRHPIKQHWVAADGLLPFNDATALITDTSVPLVNPYRHAKQSLYHQVAAHGAANRVLLTGCFGDHLYAEYGYWLRDLVTEGALKPTWQEIGRYRRQLGRRFWFPSTVAKRLLGLGGLRMTPRMAPIWLSRYGAETCLRPESLIGYRHSRPEHVALLFGQRTAASHACEYVNARHAGVEIRHPFRDWRLMEFVLSLPECALFRPGRRKRLLRLANRQRLPHLVRWRTAPTSLLDFYLHGLRNADRRYIDGLRDQAMEHYGLYLNREWLSRARPGDMPNVREETALWIVLSTALWWRTCEHDRDQHSNLAAVLDSAA